MQLYLTFHRRKCVWTGRVANTSLIRKLGFDNLPSARRRFDVQVARQLAFCLLLNRRELPTVFIDFILIVL